MSKARLQASVYAIAGAVVGCFVAVFVAVALAYGTPVHPLVYVAAISSLALTFAGVTSASRPQTGRVVAILALAGLGTLTPFLISELVPQHNIIISPITGAAVLAYLALFAFVLLYPTRNKLGVAALSAVCVLLALLAALIYAKRLRSGEYARPAYACFRWHAEPTDDLVVMRDPFSLVNHEVRLALAGAGISGTLEWTAGSWDVRGGQSRLLVLAQTNPIADKKLCPAKSGLLIYAFDGRRWITSPSDQQTYPLCLTLETQNSRTMIYQSAGGGKQGQQVFTW